MSTSIQSLITDCAENDDLGIGLAVAHYLLKQQCRLVVTARSEAPLRKLQDDFPDQVQILAGSMADDSICKKAVELATSKWQGLDGLVINHAVLDPIGRVADADVDQWRKAYDVNFFSAVSLVKAALPALRSSTGKIIFISSGAATTAYSTWGFYGSSKAAMNHLTQTLSVEEPEVTSVALRPGLVDTEMQRDIRDKHSSQMDKDDAKKFNDLPSNGGLLRPDQPGNVIAKLVMDAPKDLSGKFIT